MDRASLPRREMMDRVSSIAWRIADAGADEVEESGNWTYHDIEIDCYYDNEAARWEFEENFTKLVYSRSGYAREYTVLGYGLPSGTSGADDLCEITDYDKLAEFYGYEYDWKNDFELDEDKLADAVVKSCSFKELSAACMEDIKSKDDFQDWLDKESKGRDDNTGYGWLWMILPGMILPEKAADACEPIYEKAKKQAQDEIGMPPDGEVFVNLGEDDGISLKDGYDWYESRGYNQGDSCTVIYKKNLYPENKEENGKEDPSRDIETLIDHLLWDSPLYCVITVDGVEYRVDEELDDRYSYDKDKVITIMERLMGDNYDSAIEEYLENNLPADPDYC